MADDDDVAENDDELDDVPADEELVEDLDETFEADDDEEQEDDDAVKDDEEEEDDEEDEADTKPRTRRRASEEEDDDDEMLAPDDVEADLDRILKDRMVTTDEEEEDEEDDDVDDPTERGEGTGRLQPKRSDEQLCTSCFLLVRANAPSCPVGDDDCPLFT